MKNPVCVVIPNWDGVEFIHTAILGVQKQNQPCDIVVVDNGSHDGSLDVLRPLAKKGEITLIEHSKNLGFTGAVNAGFTYALNQGYEWIATINNDAVADEHWLKHLHERMQANVKIGIVMGKILSLDGTHIDSTGDWLSIWGLPYPRGRGEPASTVYDNHNQVLGASAGATLYRARMLRQIGLFDRDFFAYYEDIDISLRARLAGWDVYFEPKSLVYHHISATGNRVKGFTTLQTMRNLPLILVKNIPASILWHMYPRFALAYGMFFARAITDGRGWWAVRGMVKSLWLTPKKLVERHRIQRSRVITPAQLNRFLLHDLPPNAKNLRNMRALWWRIRGKA